MTDMNDLRLPQTVPPIIGEGDLRSSAVAIALTENDEIIFEVRSETVGHQPGDICLPGGRLEKDETPIQAVVREMTEELCIAEKQIEVIAPSSIFVTGTQKIHSFLCRVTGYSGSFQRDEVAQILQVPVSFFFETSPEIHEVLWKPEMGEDFPFEKIHGGRNYGWREHKSRIRFYEYEGHVIWGITARIMEEFSQQYCGFAVRCSNAWRNSVSKEKRSVSEEPFRGTEDGPVQGDH